MRLAILFGSQATGTGTARSDLDLLVVLVDPRASRVAELVGRLESRIGRDVQLVRLQDAEEVSSLVVDVLDRGRVLVDRDARWSRLQAAAPEWRSRAERDEVSLEDAMPELDL